MTYTIISYGYGDTNWKDKLTSYAGQVITYDAIGNPLEYRDSWNFTWQKGRQLATAVKSGYNISYKYTDDGIRTQKTVNGVVTDYVLSGSAILSEKKGSDTIWYNIDGNGVVQGFEFAATKFFYMKNAQGDIIGITDVSGTIVAEYQYDSWGKLIKITNSSGVDVTTNLSHIGNINPLRYRGYYYDTETGLYYVSSRYYDPETCRFINADGELAGVGESIQGYNLFAYCHNNPVNMSDPDGNWPKWLTGALNVVSGALQMAAGAALGATVGWTGVGAVVAGFLVVNGAATVTQGVGQIVNDVTKSNVMREDNIVRTGVKSLGEAIGGKTGEKVAGVVYDAAVVAANIYAGQALKAPGQP